VGCNGVSSLKVSRLFEGHVTSIFKVEEQGKQETSVRQVASRAILQIRSCSVLRSWRKKRHVSSKRMLTFKGAHGVTSQKTERTFCRVIAQAVCRRLPTEATRVRALVWPSEICGGRSGAGAGSVRVLLFPLPIFIPLNSPSSQSPGAGTIGQLVADVPSGPSLDSTPSPHYANLI
jgi:hypothetical protein